MEIGVAYNFYIKNNIPLKFLRNMECDYLI